MPVKAIIDLRILKSNAKAVKRLLPEKVKFLAVVKADGYGHGAERVANALYGIADAFAVATVTEGVKLRYGGIDKPILVLTRSENRETDTAIINGLTLTLSSFREVKRLAERADALDRKAEFQLKFDSGMKRQGTADLKEVKRIAEFCNNNGHVIMSGMYSHYSFPENEVSRNIATERFTVAKDLVKSYNKNAICHISASGGFLAGEYFDMVRIGILLYGYYPYPTDKIKVRPVMRVIAPVVAKRRLSFGEHALYGDRTAEKDTDITLLRYGYADGLFRAETAGQFNNRCMDVTAITGVKRGAKTVCVMSNAQETAKRYNTIPYEILCKCALRADKIYKV